MKKMVIFNTIMNAEVDEVVTKYNLKKTLQLVASNYFRFNVFKLISAAVFGGKFCGERKR